MSNAQIADALEELGVLYELDGAVKYRVLAYATAATAIRESPVSVAELAAAGRATEIPGVGKTLAEKIDALLETGEIPAAAKLKAKFPPTLIEVTRVPGLGAKTARRLYDELGVATIEDLRTAVESERVRALKGPRAESRGEHPREPRAARRRRGAGRRQGPALQGPPDRRGAGRGAARAPGGQPGRGRRIGPALGRDLQGHRPDRDRGGADRAGRAPRGAPADRRRRHARRQRGARPDPQRDLGRPADRRAGGLRQPAAALHRVRGPQRAAARRGGRARALGLRARDNRHRERRGGALRERGGRLRAARLRLRRARAARGPRRAEGGAGRQAAGAGRARRPARRPALPHDALGRPQQPRGDGRGRARARLRLPGDHRPLGEPRLRRPRQRRAALGADRGGRAPGTRESAASACSPARR